MLEINGLLLTLPGSIQRLWDEPLTLQLPVGQRLLIMGPSGCGKVVL
jgi:ABC-type uncharacterized transport system fused permease/ATPase subunit